MFSTSPQIEDAHSFHESMAVFLRSILVRSKLRSAIRIVRLFVHFGPWRNFVIRILQKTRPPSNACVSDLASSLPSFNPVDLTHQLREHSVAMVGLLEDDLLQKLMLRTRYLPVDDYQLIHHVDSDIKRLSEDPAITTALRSYFQCEPVLLEATIAITEHRSENDQNSFHFDYAGWESINVFVYLTDVTENSAFHIVATGSHKNITALDFLKRVLSEAEAQRRFGARIRPILGAAGTVFFENTEAFHRRNLSGERRVLLNMLYASHRSWLSHGRTTQKHIKRRAAKYLKYSNLKHSPQLPGGGGALRNDEVAGVS